MTIAEVEIRCIRTEDSVKELESTHDVSRAQHSRGRDAQGVPWRAQDRAAYRARQMLEYMNYVSIVDLAQYEGLKGFHQKELGDVLNTTRDATHFSYYHNFSSAKSNYVHFQLRNLLWATSAHDLVMMHGNKVTHWNMVTRHTDVLLDCSGRSPADSPRKTRAPFMVSTTHVYGDLIAAGGIGGELVLAAPAREDSILHDRAVSSSPNCITNSIELHESTSGAVTALVSNNDDSVRILDVATCGFVHHIALPWAANCAVVHPLCRQLIAIVGDHQDACLYDTATDKKAASLPGHLDYSFAAAWHPAGNLLATGNQDATTRVWDVRKPDQALAVLPASIGSVQSCRFSPDGRWLAVAEPTDFVQVYSVHDGLQSGQTLDMLGEFSGISFSPDSQALFAGITEPVYNSVVCFQRPDTLASDVFAH